MRLFKRKQRKNEYEKIFEKYKDQQRFVEQTIKLENIQFKVPDVVSFAFQVNDIFIDNSYQFNSQTNSPIIYDCGANVGTSILYFKKLFPKSIIKAFEADTNVFNYLEQNVKSFSDVQLFNNAVWINNDEISFNSEGADGGSLINNFETKQKIKAIRLKELLQKEEKIDFLKLDIEGAETDVILDCANELNKVEYLFVEYHSIVNHPQSMGEILSAMTNAGLRYHLETVMAQPFPYIQRNIFNNMDLQMNIYGYRI